MTSINLAPGSKVFGINIIPTPANVNFLAPDATNSMAWERMIQTWDWNGWVKPQIDFAVGNNVGLQCIRMIGAAYGVAAGLYSQEAYDACVLQVASYCKQLGVKFYACGSSKGYYSGVPVSNEKMAAIFATTFLKLEALGNCIGIDLVQEANGASLPADATIIDLISRIKQAGVTLPITCSTGEQTPSPTAGGTWINAMGQYFDFIDWHCYTFPVALNQLDFLLSQFPGKDIIIGESGKEMTRPDDEFDRDMRTVLGLMNSGNPRVRGGLIWAASDQDVAAANQWGLYTGAFAARQGRLAVVRQVLAANRACGS